MGKMKKHLTTAAATLAALVASTSASAQFDCMIGEIRPFAGNFAPIGTAFANGQLLAVSQYDALFSLYGTTYGGDGRTTFALPDLRGRAPMGAGQGPGLSNYRLGQKAGQQTTTLTAAQIPAHTHAATTETTLHGSNAVGNTADPTNARLASDPAVNLYSTAAPNASMNAASLTSTTTVAATGGGAAFDNTQPTLVSNYVVCLVGIYPSRN